MTRIQRSALVTCSAQTLFDLVNDIERYPEFLPWCVGAKIESKTDQQITAQLTVGKSGIKQSFTTCNILKRPEQMEMTLVEGPFKQLRGLWQFHALNDDACKVTFDLQFEFSNKLTALALGSVFNQAADTLVDAFCARANQLYGSKKDE
jgi:ribosome-associated toxin RatA of RatAB toxin-antitoxin module